MKLLLLLTLLDFPLLIRPSYGIGGQGENCNQQARTRRACCEFIKTIPEINCF
jgi:carbamoylphosphate synthase large subunit